MHKLSNSFSFCHCHKDFSFINKSLICTANNIGASTYYYADFVSFFLLQVKFAIQYMRRAIQKKAKFDIMDLNTIKVVFPLIFV